MNKKAIYSGTIALIAVVIISSIVFGVVSKAQAEGYRSSINEIVYLKWESQNAYQLLWESAADAVADSIFEQGCVFDTADIEDTVGTYFGNTLGATLKNCSVNGVSAELGGADEAVITFNLKCTKDVEGIAMEYMKPRTFKKQAYTDTDALGNCLVDVEDSYAGICQVDKIGSGGCS